MPKKQFFTEKHIGGNLRLRAVDKAKKSGRFLPVFLFSGGKKLPYGIKISHESGV